MITYPLNNILYSAEDAELYHCTRTSGVFSADDEFAVSVTGADNTVTIGPGIAWIRNARFSGKVAANKTSVSLDMGLADGTYPRVDAIVIRFDPNSTPDPTNIVVKHGVAASNPTPPEVIRTEALYELHLYHVRRGAGATVVSSSDVTDLRQDRNYCGVMMDDVTNIDENKFLAKAAYDPSGAVESAGGIAKYVATNAPKTTVVDSVASTSSTDAASAAAVKMAYDLANNAIPKTQKGAANGVATLDGNGRVKVEQIVAESGNVPVSTPRWRGTAQFVRIGRIVVAKLSLENTGGGFSETTIIPGVPTPVNAQEDKGYTCGVEYRGAGNVWQAVSPVFSFEESFAVYTNTNRPDGESGYAETLSLSVAYITDA